MPWKKQAHGDIVSDWLTGAFLDHTDPYLVWLDITGFRGAALPSGGGVVPVITERKTGDHRFRSGAMTKVQLRALADPAQRGEVARFEVAAGFISDDGRSAGSGTPEQSQGASGLRRMGNKPVIGFIDYGCAFAHRQFRANLNGNSVVTRVKAIWNQEPAQRNNPPGRTRVALQWRANPPGYGYGAETLRDVSLPGEPGLTLNAYIHQFVSNGVLDEQACYRHSGYGAIVNRHATHGTHMMDLATGYPSPLRALPALNAGFPNNRHDADIVFVQLPQFARGLPISGLLRANVYDAVRYIIDCAVDEQPVVINLSYGTNAGPHNGTSVLEQALDWRLKHRPKVPVTLLLPAGNAREDRLHVVANIQPGKTAIIHWHNLPDDPSDSFVELWFDDDADVSVCVVLPESEAQTLQVGPGDVASLIHGDNVVGALIFARKPCQSMTGRMALWATARTRPGASGVRAPYGRWAIEVASSSDKPIAVHAWCERDHVAYGQEGQPRQSYFSDTGSAKCDKDYTLNSIAHGELPLVVGGYQLNGAVASYSGTGPGRVPGASHVLRRRNASGRRGPDVMAPSDENAVARGMSAAAVIGTDNVRLDGTSVATALMTRHLVENGFTWPAAAPKVPAPIRGSAAPIAGNAVPTNPDQHPDVDVRRIV